MTKEQYAGRRMRRNIIKLKKVIKKFACSKNKKIIPHHDSQPYSHYQISQKALRDARKYE